MLIAHRALQGLIPLKDDGRSTTLIHKEWPETAARPEKKGRRGNFDLAILEPKEIQKHTVKEFSEGRIPPAFVVEMGLNYDLEHLRNDDEKLENSGCEYGYLIHLWQPNKGIKKEDEDKLRDWIKIGKKSKHGVAAVVFFKEGAMVKHLQDAQLANIIKE
jgi:hypothetical protein